MDIKTPIKKEEIEKGPHGLQVKTITRLIRDKNGDVKQKRVIEPALCPTCGSPLKDFSMENWYGSCMVPGCSVDALCAHCGNIARCGAVVCQKHTELIPYQSRDSGKSTIIACPIHAEIIWRSQNLIYFAHLWAQKEEFNRKDLELKMREKELKIEYVEAIVPLRVAYMEGKLKEEELRLRTYEIQRNHQIELIKAGIEKELNQIKREEIAAQKQMKREEIQARLFRTIKEHERELAKINLLELEEKRKLDELEHQKRMDRGKLKLERDRLEADKEDAARKAKLEAMDIIRERLKDKGVLELGHREEDRKSRELDHQIEADNKELELQEKEIDDAREIAERELDIKRDQLQKEALLGLGKLIIQAKAEARKDRALDHQRVKYTIQLLLEGEKVKLRADEIELAREENSRRFEEARLKLLMRKYESDQDFIVDIIDQARKAGIGLDRVREENKDIRDYQLELEKLHLLQKKLNDPQLLEG